MSRSLDRPTFDGATCIMVLSFSSSKSIVFDLSVSNVPSPTNLLTGRVVAISNVKKFVDRQMAMI